MITREECRSIVRQLWPYLDGALPDNLAERVAEHLEECTNCRSHFDFEREFLVAIRVHGSAIAPADVEPLQQRVLAALVRDGLALR